MKIRDDTKIKLLGYAGLATLVTGTAVLGSTLVAPWIAGAALTYGGGMTADRFIQHRSQTWRKIRKTLTMGKIRTRLPDLREPAEDVKRLTDHPLNTVIADLAKKAGLEKTPDLYILDKNSLAPDRLSVRLANFAYLSFPPVAKIGFVSKLLWSQHISDYTAKHFYAAHVASNHIALTRESLAELEKNPEMAKAWLGHEISHLKHDKSLVNYATKQAIELTASAFFILAGATLYINGMDVINATPLQNLGYMTEADIIASSYTAVKTVVAIGAMTCLKYAATVLKNTASRIMEYRADRGSAELNGSPELLMKAFDDGYQPNLFQRLSDTHPTHQQRAKALREHFGVASAKTTPVESVMPVPEMHAAQESRPSSRH